MCRRFASLVRCIFVAAVVAARTAAKVPSFSAASCASGPVTPLLWRRAPLQSLSKGTEGERNTFLANVVEGTV